MENMAIMCAGFTTGNVNHEEFNDWYDTEHLPRLAAVPGCLCAWRFKAASGPNQYFALYHLETPDVCASSEWKSAAVTPWTVRMRAHTSAHLRIVMRRYAKA